MGETNRHEAEEPREGLGESPMQGAGRESNEPDVRERVEGPPEVAPASEPAGAPVNVPAGAPAVDDDPAREVPVAEALKEDDGDEPREEDERGGTGTELDGEATEPDEFRRRLKAKDRHIRELYDELAAARLTSDEARTRLEAGDVRVRSLEEERERLRDTVRGFEEEERVRRRRREGQDRRAARLEREIERREDDVRRLEVELARREEELSAHGREAQSVASRKDVALEDALRRIEGLEHDLEEREDEVVRLGATIDQMRAELDLEYELRRRMAEPANRLRAGIDLFNDSPHPQEIESVSRSLGRPEVHAALESEGNEPPVVLTFTWGGVTWRTYAANPSFAVQEPRVYLQDSGEDLSGVDHEPSNAHVGPGGRVVLGL